MHGRLAWRPKWSACDLGEAEDGLENELWRRRSNGRVGEWAVLVGEKRRNGWRATYCFKYFTSFLGSVKGWRSPGFGSRATVVYDLHKWHHRLNETYQILSFPDDIEIYLHTDKSTLRAHSPTFPSLHLRQISFSITSVALPTPQLILHPFRCFACAAVDSPTLLSLLLRHRQFTYATWRAAHGKLRHIVKCYVK